MEIPLIVILALVIASFLGYLYFRDREDRKERGKMLNAILAKDAAEHMNLQSVDQAEGSTQEEELPRYEDVSGLTDEEYKELETQTLSNL